MPLRECYVLQLSPPSRHIIHNRKWIEVLLGLRYCGFLLWVLRLRYCGFLIWVLLRLSALICLLLHVGLYSFAKAESCVESRWFVRGVLYQDVPILNPVLALPLMDAPP